MLAFICIGGTYLMNRRFLNLLIIIALVIVVVVIDFPFFTQQKKDIFKRDLTPVLGLDLRGGMQVIMQAPAGYNIDKEVLQETTKILEDRANGLGVSEVVFQVAGENYILGEFPGLSNTDEVVRVIKQTGLLEWVDVGTDSIQPGTAIKTDFLPGSPSSVSNSTQQLTPTPGIDSGASGILATSQPQEKTYHTILTGSAIKSVSVDPPTNPKDGYAIQFVLSPDGSTIFSEFTKNNIGKMVAIVLDKKVISSPTIRSQIPTGEGVISGSYPNIFTLEQANNLKVTLHYGSLPVALEIVESREIGPTLGQSSLDKSLLAALIGFIIVSLFMILYYRLPGVIAVITIAIFGLIAFAVYILIPVTLTLPGIAGFLLSVGSALDANILQFERFKEELRKGRTLNQSVELGWKRAWPSIRDSNMATIITSAILFWFGSAFGATIVKGFAVTLVLGVAISLFTALFITRTLLGLAISKLENVNKSKWFGL
jgi:preprotein translocase subunit SecD